MKNYDILGREIKEDDFVISTSPAVGLRVGLVVVDVVPEIVGAPYPKKRCRVINLDYRKHDRANDVSMTPDTNRIILCECIPEEYKTMLINKAKELNYVESDDL